MRRNATPLSEGAFQHLHLFSNFPSHMFFVFMNIFSGLCCELDVRSVTKVDAVIAMGLRGAVRSRNRKGEHGKEKHYAFTCGRDCVWISKPQRKRERRREMRKTYVRDHENEMKMC